MMIADRRMCVRNWPVTAASCAAQAAIALGVWVCESSTGPARSTEATSVNRDCASIDRQFRRALDQPGKFEP